MKKIFFHKTLILAFYVIVQFQIIVQNLAKPNTVLKHTYYTRYDFQHQFCNSNENNQHLKSNKKFLRFLDFLYFTFCIQLSV